MTLKEEKSNECIDTTVTTNAQSSHSHQTHNTKYTAFYGSRQWEEYYNNSTLMGFLVFLVLFCLVFSTTNTKNMYSAFINSLSVVFINITTSNNQWQRLNRICVDSNTTTNKRNDIQNEMIFCGRGWYWSVCVCVYQFVIFGGWRCFLILSIFAWRDE
eukprot:103351_1